MSNIAGDSKAFGGGGLLLLRVLHSNTFSLPIMERLIFDINRFRGRLSRLVSRNFELIIIKMEFAVKNRDNDELISPRKKRLLAAPRNGFSLHWEFVIKMLLMFGSLSMKVGRRAFLEALKHESKANLES